MPTVIKSVQTQQGPVVEIATLGEYNVLSLSNDKEIFMVFLSIEEIDSIIAILESYKEELSQEIMKMGETK